MSNYRDYWEHNVDAWGEYYLDISHGHESLHGPKWLSALYRPTIGRLERRLMTERYARTIQFLDHYVKSGTVVSDLGCGTGVFVIEALKRGAKVNAVDFTQSALATTKKSVEKYFPKGEVSYHQLDIQEMAPPASDITLAQGLTPYISDLPAFMKNALSKTGVLFCLYADPDHWANKLRRSLPFLDVRRLRYHSRESVDALYKTHGWSLIERRDFATGYLDLASRL